MRGNRLTLHLVHLYHQGRYVRTVPRPFSLAAATAYTESYNRCGQCDGRAARLAPLELDLIPPGSEEVPHRRDT